jgi:hypothetical protein
MRVLAPRSRYTASVGFVAGTRGIGVRSPRIGGAELDTTGMSGLELAGQVVGRALAWAHIGIRGRSAIAVGATVPSGAAAVCPFLGWATARYSRTVPAEV